MASRADLMFLSHYHRKYQETLLLEPKEHLYELLMLLERLNIVMHKTYLWKLYGRRQ